jgi:hypothetical protein
VPSLALAPAAALGGEPVGEGEELPLGDWSRVFVRRLPEEPGSGVILDRRLGEQEVRPARQLDGAARASVADDRRAVDAEARRGAGREEEAIRSGARRGEDRGPANGTGATLSARDDLEPRNDFAADDPAVGPEVRRGRAARRLRVDVRHGDERDGRRAPARRSGERQRHVEPPVARPRLEPHVGLGAAVPPRQRRHGPHRAARHHEQRRAGGLLQGEDLPNRPSESGESLACAGRKGSSGTQVPAVVSQVSFSSQSPSVVQAPPASGQPRLERSDQIRGANR